MHRTTILNGLIKANKYKSYLEIGVQAGATFKAIECEKKVAVDPVSTYFDMTHKMKSDDFFAQNTETFDIIFIDGDHIDTQVDKDIENSLKFLTNGGTIVLHDCSPMSEDMQRVPVQHGPWNGTVWKSIVKIKATREDLFVATVDCDYGCAILRRGCQKLISIPDTLVYSDLEKNRKKWLNLISPKEASVIFQI